MTETEKMGVLLKKVAPRVLRAALAGFITFLLVYFLPTLLYPPEALPPGYKPLFDVFVAIVVFFAVVIELSSGTILKYAFSVARALILIMYFVYALDGGIITTEMEMAHIMVDLRGFLAMLVFVNLLGLAKSVLEAVDFLSEKGGATDRLSVTFIVSALLSLYYPLNKISVGKLHKAFWAYSQFFH